MSSEHGIVITTLSLQCQLNNYLTCTKEQPQDNFYCHLLLLPPSIITLAMHTTYSYNGYSSITL